MGPLKAAPPVEGRRRRDGWKKPEPGQGGSGRTLCVPACPWHCKLGWDVQAAAGVGVLVPMCGLTAAGVAYGHA
jgi:hypothetical protein